MPFGVEQGRAALAIRGAPDIWGSGALSISGPAAASVNTTLFIPGPGSLKMPLVIRPVQYGSGNVTLSVEAGPASGTMPLSMTSKLENTIPLYMEAQLIGSGINTGPLYLSGTPPFFISKSADLTVRGIHAGNFPGGEGVFEGAATLYINNFKTFSDNMPLHIEKDFNTANTTTLYINHRMGSGHLPLAMESTYVSNDNIALSIKPPASGNMTLYTRGYLE